YLRNLDAGKVRKETKSAQQYVLLPLWSNGLKDPKNIDVDTAFDVKENESEVYVSPSSSDKIKKMMTRLKEKLKERIKAEKARLLDAQMAKRLQDEEIEQVAARERHEKEDLEKAKVLQQQYDQKQENIDWNIVVEKNEISHYEFKP
nr:hypothetical protein [Tanacetum cinerariifolium]